MKFNFDKFIHRPSFYFLAYQGFLVFISYITFAVLTLIATLKASITFKEALKFTVIDPFGFIALGIIGIIIYAFITYICLRKILFTPLLTIFYVGILCFFFAPLIFSLYYPGGGDIIILIYIVMLFVPLATILFTLIPYLILLCIENKYNNFLKNSPRIKNKLLLTCSIIGFIIYLVIFIAGIYVCDDYSYR